MEYLRYGLWYGLWYGTRYLSRAVQHTIRRDPADPTHLPRPKRVSLLALRSLLLPGALPLAPPAEDDGTDPRDLVEKQSTAWASLLQIERR